MSRTLEAITKHTGVSLQTKSQTMKAIRIHNYGGPEVLQYEDAPRPQPQAGGILIPLPTAPAKPHHWEDRERPTKKISPPKIPLPLRWGGSCPGGQDGPGAAPLTHRP